jgi:hypothetical protein
MDSIQIQSRACPLWHVRHCNSPVSCTHARRRRSSSQTTCSCATPCRKCTTTTWSSPTPSRPWCSASWSRHTRCAVRQGPNVLLCMPNRIKCILIVSVMHRDGGTSLAAAGAEGSRRPWAFADVLKRHMLRVVGAFLVCMWPGGARVVWCGPPRMALPPSLAGAMGRSPPR